MEALASPANWGSPLGLALILTSVGFLLAGLGIMIWGASHDRKAKAAQAEVALRERQFSHERTRGEGA